MGTISLNGVFIKRLQRLERFIDKDIIKAMGNENLGFFEAIGVNIKLNKWIRENGEINGEKDNFSRYRSEYKWIEFLRKQKQK